MFVNSGKKYTMIDGVALLCMSVGLIAFTLADSNLQPEFNQTGVCSVVLCLCGPNFPVHCNTVQVCFSSPWLCVLMLSLEMFRRRPSSNSLLLILRWYSSLTSLGSGIF